LSTDCVAVGNYYNGTADQTLAESSSGGTWSIVPSANAGTDADNFLQGVSCVSSTDCVAVGNYFNGTDDQTLAESSSGGAWSVVPSANAGTDADNFLQGASCVSSTDCVAVGNYFNGSNYQTLIESYDGTTWSVMPSPDVSGFLLSVSCSGTSCTAVGSTEGAPSQTLIESLSGSVWSVIPSPNTSASETNTLLSVSCASTTSCVATGDFEDGSLQQTLVEVFNGSTWTIVPSADASTSDDNVLSGVTCLSSTACTAVGYSTPNDVQQTLIESYDGSTWSIVSSPNTGTLQTNYLSGVWCTSSVTCSAVGSYGNSLTPAQTLIESFAVKLPPPPKPPTVTGLSPNTGSLNSSPSINIVGTGLANASEVQFGSVPSPSFNQEPNGNIYAKVPAGLVGTSNVTVTTPLGQSPESLADVYTATGYWEVAADGRVFSFGAGFDGSISAKLNQPIVGMARTSNAGGYWFAARDGGVFAFGNAAFHGSAAGVGVAIDNVVGVVPDVKTGGYWLVSSDGGVFAFDAPYFGSVPGLSLNVTNIVGMAATPDDNGYYLFGSDGGVFAFGQAVFRGSMGGQPLNQPIVGMAVDPLTGGYWEVARDGGIFAFGAPFYGSTGGITLNKPVVAMSANAGGTGYWFVASDGGIFAFGHADFRGSMGGQPLNQPIVGMAGA
jgi:hypothetical protein